MYGFSCLQPTLVEESELGTDEGVANLSEASSEVTEASTGRRILYLVTNK